VRPLNQRRPDDGEPRGGPAPGGLHIVGPPAAASTGGAGPWWPWYGLPLLLLLSGPLVLALVVLDAPPWLRLGPVLTYLTVVPGLAGVRLLRLPDRAFAVLLGIGLSLALGMLVAQIMIYLHAWSATLGVAVLVLVASVAGLVELYRGPVPGPPAPTSGGAGR
jgi:hypothetical protein